MLASALILPTVSPSLGSSFSTADKFYNSRNDIYQCILDRRIDKLFTVYFGPQFNDKINGIHGVSDRSQEYYNEFYNFLILTLDKLSHPNRSRNSNRNKKKLFNLNKYWLVLNGTVRYFINLIKCFESNKTLEECKKEHLNNLRNGII